MEIEYCVNMIWKVGKKIPTYYLNIHFPQYIDIFFLVEKRIVQNTLIMALSGDKSSMAQTITICQEMNSLEAKTINLITAILENEATLNSMLHQLEFNLDSECGDIPSLIQSIINQCNICNITINELDSLMNLNISLQKIDMSMSPDEVIQVSLNNIHIIKQLGVRYGVLCS